MTLLIGSLQLGFLYSIMVLGIYISFRILNIPDLTTEGSFTFGLAASSILTAAGHPYRRRIGRKRDRISSDEIGYSSGSGRHPDNEWIVFD